MDLIVCWGNLVKTVFILASLAMFKGIHAQNKSLCTKWKTDGVNLLVLSSAPDNQFLVLDSNFNGYLVPSDRLSTTNMKPTLNLAGSKSIHLSLAESLSSEVQERLRTKQKGVFLFLPSKDFPSPKPHVAIFSEDMKTIEFMPLDANEKVINKNFVWSDNSLQMSELPVSLTCPGSSIQIFTDNQVIIYDLDMINEELSITEKSSHRTNFTVVDIFLDGGYSPSLNEFFGFSNGQTNLHYCKGIVAEENVDYSCTVCPYKDFFICKADIAEADPALNASSIQSFKLANIPPQHLIFGIVSAILITVVAIILIKKNKASKGTKKSVEFKKLKQKAKWLKFKSQNNRKQIFKRQSGTITASGGEAPKPSSGFTSYKGGSRRSQHLENNKKWTLNRMDSRSSKGNMITK